MVTVVVVGNKAGDAGKDGPGDPSKYESSPEV